MEAQHTNSQSSLVIAGLTQKVREESAFVDSVINEVQKVIVGQRHMVERVLIGLLAGGHVLLEAFRLQNPDPDHPVSSPAFGS